MPQPRITLREIKNGLDHISTQVAQLNKYIVGNGNPERGLLFRMAQNEQAFNAIANNCARIQEQKKKSEIDEKQNETISRLLSREEKNKKIADALPGNGKILGLDKKLFLTIVDKILSYLWKLALALILGDQAINILTKL